MASTIAQMTPDELREMLEATIDRKMTEWLGDPDTGLELRPEVVELIQRQREKYAAGKRGRSLQEVKQRLRVHVVRHRREVYKSE